MLGPTLSFPLESQLGPHHLLLRHLLLRLVHRLHHYPAHHPSWHILSHVEGAARSRISLCEHETTNHTRYVRSYSQCRKFQGRAPLPKASDGPYSRDSSGTQFFRPYRKTTLKPLPIPRYHIRAASHI